MKLLAGTGKFKKKETRKKSRSKTLTFLIYFDIIYIEKVKGVVKWSFMVHVITIPIGQISV